MIRLLVDTQDTLHVKKHAKYKQYIHGIFAKN